MKKPKYKDNISAWALCYLQKAYNYISRLYEQSKKEAKQ